MPNTEFAWIQIRDPSAFVSFTYSIHISISQTQESVSLKIHYSYLPQKATQKYFQELNEKLNDAAQL